MTEPVQCKTGCDWCALEATQESLREHMARIRVLEQEKADLLFALHDAWPYVHQWCTIESKRKPIQALIVKHGEFADLV